MEDRRLFEDEDRVIRDAAEALADPALRECALGPRYAELLEQFTKTVKQLRLLVKLSDRQQLKLNRLNEQLDLRNRFIQETFGRYLSDDVVQRILESPEGASLGGERRIVTLMMADIRGFTAITERLPAEQVVGIITRYLEKMTEIIFRHGGTIDEFFGDGILAIFGAPFPHADDAERAVRCAVEMQLAVEEVNRANREAGDPEIEMGVGLNTGEVIVGNIGCFRRTKYGVIGSNVNLTSRIESFTTGGQIFISESTREQCGAPLRLDGRFEIRPKGFPRPVTVFEIGGITGEGGLCLPEKMEEALADLIRPIPVRFWVLSGKHADAESEEGSLIACSRREARLRTLAPLDRLSDLKAGIMDGEAGPHRADFYAKVARVVGKAPVDARIVFTSLPPEVRDFLKSHMLER